MLSVRSLIVYMEGVILPLAFYLRYVVREANLMILMMYILMIVCYEPQCTVGKLLMKSCFAVMFQYVSTYVVISMCNSYL